MKVYHYRLRLNGNRTGNFHEESGDDATDQWEQLRLSGRVDWKPEDSEEVSLSFGSFQLEQESEVRVAMPPPTTLSLLEDKDLHSYGHYALARWEKSFSRQNSLMLQGYYDIYSKDNVERSEKVETYDLEARNTVTLNEFHRVTLGVGYRTVKDEVENSDFTSFDPDEDRKDTFRLYAQDEISLIKDELKLILGTKYERNAHTGSEWQPGAKLLWMPSEEHTFWTSVAQAVRTPSRGDEDFSTRLFYAGPSEFRIHGERNLESEKLLAYEAGYRLTPEDSAFSLDLSLFYNDYEDFLDTEFSTGGLQITDNSDGYTYGAEAFISYWLTDEFKLKASYSYLDVRMSSDTVFTGGTPSHMASLGGEYQITDSITFIQSLHYTEAYKSQRNEYDNFYRLDLGLQWQVTDSLKFSAWGLNLLDPQTLEYADNQTTPTELPRSFYLQLEWVF